ncbi:hypothetical protein [Sinorhizobium fredii]|uniref:hypothetical protein n=1 Tax=Rhizobium fredii TaxID=380 RepID=UPI000CF2C496|nr:hypothetical protein [Sinorhizobium fredii]
MAVRTANITYPGSNILTTWTGLLNGDTGAPFAAADWPIKTVQVTGTLGAGGSVRLEGTCDGSTWATLHMPDNNDLVFTALGIEKVLENPLLIRPAVTAGDGSTNLAVRVVGSRER